MTEQHEASEAPPVQASTCTSTRAAAHSQLMPGQHRADTSQEVLAASKFSQQLIEQKERELHESIAINYTRIKDVERELRELQMQVKLTAEPKKQALELLRKKIELQNTRVQAVRRRYEVAKQAYEQLQSELEQEESAKEQLCDELNQLVTTSVSSQLERFEQLKVKLEALHGGPAGAIGRASSAPVQCHTAGAAAGPAGQGAPQQPTQGSAEANHVQAAQQQQQQEQQLQTGPPLQLPVSTAAVVPEDAGQDAAAAAAAAAAKAAALAKAAAAAEAEAARARHVQLPGRSRHKAASTAGGAAGLAAATQQTGSRAGSGQGSRPSTMDRNGNFAGFDA